MKTTSIDPRDIGLILVVVLIGTVALAAVGGTPAVVVLPAIIAAVSGLIVAVSRLGHRD